MPDTGSNVQRFHGEFLRGIDDSRRVMMPPEWKPKDPETIYMAIAWPLKTKEYLLVLTLARWQVMQDKLKTKSLNDKRVASVERLIGANSAPLALDKVGRFSLPEDLANKVGLKKEAQLVSRVDKFEIWNPERYAAMAADDEAVAAEAAAEMDL